MTRTIRATDLTGTPEGQRDFALGALAAAGHSIEDPESLELLDRLTRGEIDFVTFKQSAIERHKTQ